MSLKKKAVGGLFWTFIQQFSNKIISFVVSIILARLLSPSQFGLIGMLSIFISVGTSLLDSGMTSSIIRTKNADQADYSTVFILNMLASLFVYVVVFLLAPFIADFYKQPVLKDLVRVYSVTFFFTAIMGIQSAKLTKEMNFKVQMFMEIPSIIAGGALGIFLAYKGFGVWSLVYMFLLQSGLLSLQHWYYSDWRPSFEFSVPKFKQHFNFGYKVTLHGLISTLYSNVFTIIIGKFYSAAQLGFYSRALSLRQFPISNLSAALEKVTFPMFSSINDDDVKLKSVYKRLIQQVIFWIVPLLMLLIVTAEPLFRVLLTEKWVPAVPYFQILCVSGMLLPLLSYNGNIIKVKGRTDIILKVQIYEKIFSVVAILVALQFGLFALLYSQIVSAVLAYSLLAYFGGRMVKYSMLEQLKDIFPSVSLALIIAYSTWLLNHYVINLFHIADLPKLILESAFYFVLYLGISQLFKLKAILDFRQLLFKKS